MITGGEPAVSCVSQNTSYRSRQACCLSSHCAVQHPCALQLDRVRVCRVLRDERCLRAGTRGIGYGIANCLARDGYDLLLGYNANAERANTVRTCIPLLRPFRKDFGCYAA